jgi:hypothetical protein
MTPSVFFGARRSSATLRRGYWRNSEQLTARSYIVEKIGESRRILPHAIRQKFTTRAEGELEPFNEGSAKPVTIVVTHAGIVVVEQFDLRTP